MFSQWPDWLSRSPVVRRLAIKLWRVLLRVQRATLAKAVLVLQRGDGRVLVLPSPSGGLALPVKQLDAWVPITTQVETWLSQLLQGECKPSLVAIDGTPAREGVTLLYAATAELLGAKNSDQLWLDTDDAISSLRDDDARLLRLYTSRAP